MPVAAPIYDQLTERHTHDDSDGLVHIICKVCWPGKHPIGTQALCGKVWADRKPVDPSPQDLWCAVCHEIRVCPVCGKKQ